MLRQGQARGVRLPGAGMKLDEAWRTYRAELLGFVLKRVGGISDYKTKGECGC